MHRIIMGLLLILASSNASEITLGVVPQQSPLKLAKKWSKVTQYLHEATGIKVIFKTEKSIAHFEKKLYAGKYDISYMNPYHFVVAQRLQGYEAFVRAKKNIVGILLSTQKNVTFTKENLKGKTFLFPSPNAFAATLLPKFELKQKINFNVDTEAKMRYVNSHDSVYKGISRGLGYLGGGIIRTYNNFQDKNDKDKLNIVYRTSAYPSHPIAAHPRLTQRTVKKIQKAFLDMPDDIKKRFSIKDFRITTSSEYDVIKQIGIK